MDKIQVFPNCNHDCRYDLDGFCEQIGRFLIRKYIGFKLMMENIILGECFHKQVSVSLATVSS